MAAFAIAAEIGGGSAAGSEHTDPGKHSATNKSTDSSKTTGDQDSSAPASTPVTTSRPPAAASNPPPTLQLPRPWKFRPSHGFLQQEAGASYAAERVEDKWRSGGALLGWAFHGGTVTCGEDIIGHQRTSLANRLLLLSSAEGLQSCIIVFSIAADTADNRPDDRWRRKLASTISPCAYRGTTMAGAERYARIHVATRPV